MKNTLIRTAILLGSGAVFALAYPMANQAWLAWFALAPMFYFLFTTRRNYFMIGFTVSAAVHLVMMGWARYFHPLALPLLVPLLGAWWGLAAMVVGRFSRSFPRWRAPIAAIVWVVMEYTRSIGFLAYPWGLIGYSQYQFLPLIQIAELTGVWGVSLPIVFANCLLADTFTQAGPAAVFGSVKGWILSLLRRPGRETPVVGKVTRRTVTAWLILGGIVAVMCIYGAIRMTEKTKRSARIAAIQQNIDPNRPWTPEKEKHLSRLIALSQEAALERPDLIVWPETAIMQFLEYYFVSPLLRENTAYHSIREFLLNVYRLPRDLDTYLITGAPDRTDTDGRYEIFNCAMMISPQAKITGKYRKMHLVPFGEWFPYGRLFPWVTKILRAADAGSFTPGREPNLLEAGSLRCGVAICFEDIFGNLCRRSVQRGADVLINITNDAWAYSTASQTQHMSMSVFRAVENRRSVVRAANSGVTCAIGPSGRILGALPVFQDGFIVRDVPLRSGRTPYTRWGDWFAWLLCVITAAAAAGALLRKYRSS